MRSKDLKTAALLTLICFLLSYGFAYSYAHNRFLTRGTLPLILTVVLVFLATIVLEVVTSISKISAQSQLHVSGFQNTNLANAGHSAGHPTDYLSLPIHASLWLIFFVFDTYATRHRRALKASSDSMLKSLREPILQSGKKLVLLNR